MNTNLKINKIDKNKLENFYVESEFIDSINEIFIRIEDQINEPISQPFLVMKKNDVVSFFTIESLNPNITNTKCYWLESFF